MPPHVTDEGVGRYEFEYVYLRETSEFYSNHRIVVGDTKTGSARVFYYSHDEKKMVEFTGGALNMP